MKGEKVPATIFVGSLASGVVGIELDTSSYEQKIASATRARNAAILLDADFTLTFSESWGLPDGLTEKQATDILKKYGSVSAYPGRCDLVFLQMETKEGMFAGRASILACPPSKKKRRLSPFTWMQSQGAAGILAGILPLKNGPEKSAD